MLYTNNLFTHQPFSTMSIMSTMPSLELNSECITSLSNILHTTWNEIGKDFTILEEGPVDNKEALIYITTNSHLYFYGADIKGNQLFKEYVQKFGYTTVIEFLNQHIKLRTFEV